MNGGVPKGGRDDPGQRARSLWKKARAGVSGAIALPLACREEVVPNAEHRPRNSPGWGMLEATSTASAISADWREREVVFAGRSRVSPEHWLPREHPDWFKPCDSRDKLTAELHRSALNGSRVETRTRAATPARTAAHAPARPLHIPAPSPPAWKPLVRLNTRSAPSFTVRLSDRAYRSMGDQAWSQRGQIETGGALFGHPAHDRDDRVTVIRAGEPGPRTRSSRTRMIVDVDHILREAKALNADRDSALGWIGFWHTHPSVDNGCPSDGDLGCFAKDCRELHRMGRSMQHYIGLILTPTWHWPSFDSGRVAGWHKPEIHAWHMQPVAVDQFICARAEVVRL